MNYMGLMFFGSQGFIDFKMWVARKKVWETLAYLTKTGLANTGITSLVATTQAGASEKASLAETGML